MLKCCGLIAELILIGGTMIWHPSWALSTSSSWNVFMYCLHSMSRTSLQCNVPCVFSSVELGVGLRYPCIDLSIFICCSLSCQAVSLVGRSDSSWICSWNCIWVNVSYGNQSAQPSVVLFWVTESDLFHLRWPWHGARKPEMQEYLLN